MINYAFDEKRTKEEIEKGTSREDDNKPWIWNHSNAASTKYNYVEKPKPNPVPDVETPTVDTPAPRASSSTSTSTSTPDSGEVSDGQRRFLSWIRSTLGL